MELRIQNPGKWFVEEMRQHLPDEWISGLRQKKTVGTIGPKHEQLHAVVLQITEQVWTRRLDSVARGTILYSKNNLSPCREKVKSKKEESFDFFHNCFARVLARYYGNGGGETGVGTMIHSAWRAASCPKIWLKYLEQFYPAMMKTCKERNSVISARISY